MVVYSFLFSLQVSAHLLPRKCFAKKKIYGNYGYEKWQVNCNYLRKSFALSTNDATFGMWAACSAKGVVYAHIVMTKI